MYAGQGQPWGIFFKKKKKTVDPNYNKQEL